MNIQSQKQQTVRFEVLTIIGQTLQCEELSGSGQTIERAVNVLTQKQLELMRELLTEGGQILQCGVLPGTGQAVEDSSGHRDKITDGTV